MCVKGVKSKWVVDPIRDAPLIGANHWSSAWITDSNWSLLSLSRGGGIVDIDDGPMVLCCFSLTSDQNCLQTFLYADWRNLLQTLQNCQDRKVFLGANDHGLWSSSWWPFGLLDFVLCSGRKHADIVVIKKTSQELRMLSSVTINCQVTKIVMNSGYLSS